MARREKPRAPAQRAQVIGGAAPPRPVPPRPAPPLGAHLRGGGADSEGPEAGSQGAAARGDRGPASRGRPRRSGRCGAGGNRRRLSAAWSGGARGAARGDPAQGGRAAGLWRGGGRGLRCAVGPLPGAQRGAGLAPQLSRASGSGARRAGVRCESGPCPSRGASRPQPHRAYCSVWVFISCNSFTVWVGGPRGPFPGLLSDACSREPWAGLGPLDGRVHRGRGGGGAVTWGGARDRAPALPGSVQWDPRPQGGETLVRRGSGQRWRVG